jgi:dipeptidyl aminopeptidase/acylaminoacyl peptidase
MDKRPITAEDLTRFRVPSDPQMSPDGKRIAFVVKTMDTEKNRYFNHIHAVPADGSAPSRQWTHSVGSETMPRWSPDGKTLAFVSGREEKLTQIYLLPTDGGEGEKVTDLPPGSIADVQWSPDGTRLAFTFRPQDEEWTEKATEARKTAKKSSPPRVINRRRFRSEGEGFRPSVPYRLHVFEIATRETTILSPEDGPDEGAFCWSPDGTEIAVVRNTADDPDRVPNHVEIFIIPASKPEGNAPEPRRLNAPLGPKYSLAWSPNGTQIAFLGHDDPTEMWGVKNIHPWAVPVNGDPARDLTPDYDVQFGNVTIGDLHGSGDSGPAWSSGGTFLYVLASVRGTVELYRVAPSGGEAEPLTNGAHAVTGFALGPDGDGVGDAFALLRNTPTDAGDIYLMPSQDSVSRRLTDLNADLLAEINVPTPLEFEAPAPDGKPIPCFALFPRDFDHENPTPCPTLLYIHGGPHLMYCHSLFHEYHYLAAQGYVALFPNPRGSKGYGEEWTGAIRGNWGEPAHDDCMAVVDYAIARGWSDTERLGVAGGSYGGYLTAWIVGHTDRFKAALAERGVFSLISMAGTCDFPWRDNDYFGGNTTDDIGELHRNSPLTYADAITTPLLILASEGDLRCPIGQSEELFSALIMRDRDVTFLRYGLEGNHTLSRTGPPDLRLDRLNRIREWFDRYLKQEAVTGDKWETGADPEA